MGVYQRGVSSFQASFMVKGVRYRETFKSHDEAERWERGVRSALKEGKPLPVAVPGSGVSTIGELMEYTIKHHYSNLPASNENAMRISRHITEFTGTEMLVKDIDARTIDELVAHFQEEYGNTLATVNRKLAVLSKAFFFAVRLGVIDKKPELVFYKEHLPEIRYFTVDEVERMERTARAWGDHDLADLIIIGVDTGARVSEVFKSPWAWFSPDLDRWSIWVTKANQPRTIPLTSRCQDILKRRKEKGEAGPFHRYEYGKYRRRFVRLAQTLEIDRATIHKLRHTCASRLVQRGVDIRRVQIWMGHKALATTLRYAHLAPEHLDVALNALEAAE